MISRAEEIHLDAPPLWINGRMDFHPNQRLDIAFDYILELRRVGIRELGFFRVEESYMETSFRATIRQCFRLGGIGIGPDETLAAMTVAAIATPGTVEGRWKTLFLEYEAERTGAGSAAARPAPSTPRAGSQP